MSEQDEILKDVIYSINKTNHELDRLKIILKENKRQLRHKNIIIVFLFILFDKYLFHYHYLIYY